MMASSSVFPSSLTTTSSSSGAGSLAMSMGRNKKSSIMKNDDMNNNNSSWRRQRRPRAGGGGRQDRRNIVEVDNEFDYNSNEDLNFNNVYYNDNQPIRQRQSDTNNNFNSRRRITPSSSNDNGYYGNYDEFDLQQRQYRQSTFRRDPGWPQQQQQQKIRQNNMIQQQDGRRNLGGKPKRGDWGDSPTNNGDSMQDSSYYDYNVEYGDVPIPNNFDSSLPNINTFGRGQQQRQQQGRSGRDERNNSYETEDRSGLRKKMKQYTEDFRRGNGSSSTSTSSTSFLSTPPSWSFERNTIPSAPTTFRRQGSMVPSTSYSSNIVIGEKYTSNFRRGSNTYDKNDVVYDDRMWKEEEEEWQRRDNEKTKYTMNNNIKNKFRYPRPRPPLAPTTQPPPSKMQQEQQQQQRYYYESDQPPEQSNERYFGGRMEEQRPLVLQRQRSPITNNQQQSQPPTQQYYYEDDTMPPTQSETNTGIFDTTATTSRNRTNEPSFGNGGIKRLINKLFEPYSSVFGGEDTRGMNRVVDSELTRSVEDEKRRMKSILMDARKLLQADPAVRNMLGSDLQLGVPISKTYSSTMVDNGITRSRLQLVIPVSSGTGSRSSSSSSRNSGRTTAGRIRIVANQDGITQLECDVGGGRIIDIPIDGKEDRASVIDASVVERDVYS